MGVRGVITEFFDLPEFERQLKAAKDGVGSYIDTVKSVPEIRSGLTDPSKVKESLEAMKKLAELNAKVAELNTKLAETQEKLNKLNEEAAKSQRNNNSETQKGTEELGKFSTALQENIAKQVEYKSRLEEIGKGLKDLKKQQELLSKTEGNDEAKKQIKDRIQAYSEEQAQIKVLSSEIGKLITNQIKESESVEGSIKEAQQSVALLIKERDNLNLTTEAGIAKQEEYNDEIDKLNEFIRVNVSELEKQKINVGNYQGSAKIIVDALKGLETQIASLKEKQQSLVDFSKSNPIGFKLAGGSEELNQVNAKLGFTIKQSEALSSITGDPKFLNIAAKVGDTNKELGFFTQRLNQLEDAGLKNTDVYRQVEERLSKLTDQLADTKANLKALSSDTRQFDLFAGAVTFAADAFQTFAGVAVLAGASEEDAAKATKTLIAVQSVANGVKGIANELTTKGTAANKAFAFVQGLVATAFDKSAAAGKRFNAALGLLGIAATVIGAIVIAFAKFNKATAETVSRQKILNDLTKAAADNYGEEKAQLDILVNVIRSEASTRKDKLNALKELQDKYPGYFDNLKTEKDLNDKLALAYANAAAGILDKAKAQAGQDKISKNEAERLRLTLDLEQGIQKLEEDAAKNRSKIRKQDLAQFEADLPKERELRKKEFEKRIKEIDAENKIILDLTVTGQKKLLEDKNKTNPEDAAKKAKEAADRELSVRNQIRQVELQRIADFSKEVADNEKASDLERLFFLNEYVKARNEIINNQANTERKLGQKTASELNLIEVQRNDELKRLQFDAEKDRLKIVESGIIEGLKISKEEKAALDKLGEEALAGFKVRTDKQVEISKQLLEIKKQYAEQEREMYFNLYDELTGFATDFFTSQQDLQIKKNDEDISAIDLRKQKEIDAVNQNVTDRKKAADEIAIIEAKAQADKAVLENKNKELERRKANIERIGQVATITGNTVQGIVSLSIKAAEARAQAALLASNPLTAAFAPVALAQSALISAQIPFIIGLGAAQLARLVLPRFKDGGITPGGPVIVGDGGKSEAAVLPDGTVFKTPATSTVVDLPKGTQIFPDFSKMLLSASIKELPDVKVSVPYDRTERAVKQLGKDLIRTIKEKQENHFHLPGRYETAMRDGSKFRAYLKDNL